MDEIKETEFLSAVRGLYAESRLHEEDAFTQHGNTSCLKHSLAVAYYSYRFALKLGGERFNLNELIRGALLHDYFLYDWHVKPFHEENGLHGFSHPLTAWQNATRDFSLTDRECDIIRKHMFPLTLTKIPKYRESWIVTTVDKWLSLYEVFGRKTYRVSEIEQAYEMIMNRI